MPDAADLPAGHDLSPASAWSAGLDPRSTLTRRRTARRHRWTAAIVVVIVVVMVAAGMVGYRAIRGGGPRFRTAEVTKGDVAQTVTATGTVASASRDDASFAVSGTVASVAVKVGDTVTAGQTLATLNADALATDVQNTQDALTTAQQKLADDREAQATGTVVASSSATGTQPSAYVHTLPTTGTATATATNAVYVTGSARVVAAAAPSAGPSASPSAAGLASLREAVTDAQRKLLTQYDTVNTTLTDAQNALGDDTSGSTATCAAFLTAAGDTLQAAAKTPAGEATSGSSATPAPAATGDAFTEAPSPDTAANDPVAALRTKLDACEQALGLVQDDQKAVQSAQQQLLDDAKALDAAVDALSKALSTAGSADGSNAQGSGSGGQSAGTGAATPAPSRTSTPTGSSAQRGESGSKGGAGANSTEGTTGATNKGSGLTGGGTTGGQADSRSSTGTGTHGTSGSTAGSAQQTVTITAEQILADQADIDEAQANLAVAQANAARGTLTSRIAGTVAAVSVSSGSSVSTSSTAVTVLGTTGYVVETTVPLVQTTLLQPGQPVQVSVAGTTAPVHGTVSQVGVVNQSETSTPSYPVSITLDAGSGSLFDGASAQLAISVAAADAVTVVPTSAVTASGTIRTVQVLDGGKVTTTRVKTGAVGPELTQITSGVDVGQKVVLADLDKGLPTSSTTTNPGLTTRQFRVGTTGGAGMGGYSGSFTRGSGQSGSR